MMALNSTQLTILLKRISKVKKSAIQIYCLTPVIDGEFSGVDLNRANNVEKL